MLTSHTPRSTEATCFPGHRTSLSAVHISYSPGSSAAVYNPMLCRNPSYRVCLLQQRDGDQRNGKDLRSSKNVFVGDLVNWILERLEPGPHCTPPLLGVHPWTSGRSVHSPVLKLYKGRVEQCAFCFSSPFPTNFLFLSPGNKQCVKHGFILFLTQLTHLGCRSMGSDHSPSSPTLGTFYPFDPWGTSALSSCPYCWNSTQMLYGV